MASVAGGLLDIASQIGVSPQEKALRAEERYKSIKITPAQMGALRPYVALALKKTKPGITDADAQADQILARATQRDLPELRLMVQGALAIEKAQRKPAGAKKAQPLDVWTKAQMAALRANPGLDAAIKKGDSEAAVQLVRETASLAGTNVELFPDATNLVKTLDAVNAKGGFKATQARANQIKRDLIAETGGWDKYVQQDYAAAKLLDAYTGPITGKPKSKLGQTAAFFGIGEPTQEPKFPVGSGLVETAPK